LCVLWPTVPSTFDYRRFYLSVKLSVTDSTELDRAAPGTAFGLDRRWFKR
jgi:hypothetical protein